MKVMETQKDENPDYKLVEIKQEEITTRPVNFGIDVEKIEEIFKGYDNRIFDEDLLKIEVK